MNVGKELTESSIIKIKDENQQYQEIELNFNAISKIYKQENRVSSFDGTMFSSSLATGLIPTHQRISTLIKQVEERYPRPVATSASAVRSESTRGGGIEQLN